MRQLLPCLGLGLAARALAQPAVPSGAEWPLWGLVAAGVATLALLGLSARRRRGRQGEAPGRRPATAHLPTLPPEDLAARAERAFHALGAFAPANWRDIRGNGSEAQRAEPERARLLLESVTARAAMLRAVRERAQRHLEALEAEARQDAGTEPKAAEAERLLARIREELAMEKPDWLAVTETLQATERLLLEAGTGDELERRARLLASERLEAEASLARLEHFCRVHAPDLGSAVRAGLEQAQDAHRSAARRQREAERLTGTERARTLAEATAGFDHAQRLAEETFVAAERDFGEMEALRAQLAETGAKVEARLATLPAGHALRPRAARLPATGALHDLDRARLTALLEQASALEAELRAQGEEDDPEARQRATERARRSCGWGALGEGGW